MQQRQLLPYNSGRHERRKYFGMQTVDQKVSNLLTRLFKGSKKEFVLISNLVKNWEEIIGSKFYKFCYPKSVRFERVTEEKYERSRNPYGGILTIAVYNAAVGTQLGWLQESIIERIACLYGHKSIRKIIIKQEPQLVQTTRSIIISKEDEFFLQEKLTKIENKELADTLFNLGKEIFNKPKT